MDNKNIEKKYTNGEVTVIWKPDMCIHSGICFKELPTVFNPHNRPWVNIEGATTQSIIDQVRNCPSGAISFYMNNKHDKMEEEKIKQLKGDVIENGPIILKGDVMISYKGANIIVKNPALCRCGASKNKPYCDGAHQIIKFQG